MESSLTVKAYLYREWSEGSLEIRRFALDSAELNQFKVLLKKIAVAFSRATEEQLKLHWIDEEGDRVTISNDEELALALQSCSGNLFKVHVLLMQPSDSQPSRHAHQQEPQSGCPPDRGVYHPNVVCDGCEGPVHGVRYKCQTCKDFDLCSTCQSKGVHSDHSFEAINSPRFFWFGPRRCGGGRGRWGGGPGGWGRGFGGCGGGFGGWGRGCEGPGVFGPQASQDQREVIQQLVQNASAFLRPYGVSVSAHLENQPTQQEDLEEKIAMVTEQLKAMGFDNDGGWLTELIRTKNADINKVLETLQWTN